MSRRKVLGGGVLFVWGHLCLLCSYFNHSTAFPSVALCFITTLLYQFNKGGRDKDITMFAMFNGILWNLYF